MVLIFVTLGTFYDIALRYHVLRTGKNDQSIENTPIEMKNSSPNEITIMKLWSVKEHNGTLGILVQSPRFSSLFLLLLINVQTFSNFRHKQFGQRAEASVGNVVILQSALKSFKSVQLRRWPRHISPYPWFAVSIHVMGYSASHLPHDKRSFRYVDIGIRFKCTDTRDHCFFSQTIKHLNRARRPTSFTKPLATVLTP